MDEGPPSGGYWADPLPSFAPLPLGGPVPTASAGHSGLDSDLPNLAPSSRDRQRGPLPSMHPAPRQGRCGLLWGPRGHSVLARHSLSYVGDHPLIPPFPGLSQSLELNVIGSRARGHYRITSSGAQGPWLKARSGIPEGMGQGSRTRSLAGIRAAAVEEVAPPSRDPAWSLPNSLVLPLLGTFLGAEERPLRLSWAPSSTCGRGSCPKEPWPLTALRLPGAEPSTCLEMPCGIMAWHVNLAAPNLGKPLGQPALTPRGHRQAPTMQLLGKLRPQTPPP